MKNIHFALVGLMIFFSSIPNYAQDYLNSKNKNSISSTAKTFWSDALYIASSPLKMSKQDACRLSILAATTATFITLFDAQTTDEFVTLGEDMDADDGLLIVGKRLAHVGTVYDKISSGYILGGLTTGMLTGGFIFKNQKMLLTTRLMIESIVINEVITALSKGMIGRSRPYTGRGSHNFSFFKFTTNADYLSMPSGHTSSVFSMMTVIAEQYDHRWIKIPAYTFCLSVGLQRIDADKHWTSDVIIGGALGYWVGKTLVNKYKKPSHSISFNPYFSTNRVGVSFTF